MARFSITKGLASQYKQRRLLRQSAVSSTSTFLRNTQTPAMEVSQTAIGQPSITTAPTNTEQVVSGTEQGSTPRMQVDLAHTSADRAVIASTPAELQSMVTQTVRNEVQQVMGGIENRLSALIRGSSQTPNVLSQVSPPIPAVRPISMIQVQPISATQAQEPNPMALNPPLQSTPVIPVAIMPAAAALPGAPLPTSRQADETSQQVVSSEPKLSDGRAMDIDSSAYLNELKDRMNKVKTAATTAERAVNEAKQLTKTAMQAAAANDKAIDDYYDKAKAVYTQMVNTIQKTMDDFTASTLSNTSMLDPTTDAVTHTTQQLDQALNNVHNTLGEIQVKPVGLNVVSPAMHKDVQHVSATVLPSTVSHAHDSVSTHSNIRVPLPPIPIWDGKDPYRRAETFLSDIERYALLGSQDAMTYLEAHIQSATREAIHLVRDKRLSTGQLWNWTICKQEFIKLSGDKYKQLQQQALLDIVEGRIVQKPDQTIVDYRLALDNKILEAGGQMPEQEQAVQFLRGLLPDVHKRCTGDAQGSLFPNIETAFIYAQNIERQLQLEKTDKAKTGTVAVTTQSKRAREDDSQSQSQFKRGRGNSGPSRQRGGGGGGPSHQKGRGRHDNNQGQYNDRSYQQAPPPPFRGQPFHPYRGFRPWRGPRLPPTIPRFPQNPQYQHGYDDSRYHQSSQYRS